MSVKKEPITVPWKTQPQQTASTHMVDSVAHVHNTWDIDCMTLLDAKVIPTFRSKVKTFLLRVYSQTPDIDECSEGISGCNQNCENIIGSYSCFCNEGFTLMKDSRTCVGEKMSILYISSSILWSANLQIFVVRRKVAIYT